MEKNNHILFSNSKILNLQQTNLAERIHVHAIGIDMVLSLVHTIHTYTTCDAHNPNQILHLWGQFANYWLECFGYL